MLVSGLLTTGMAMADERQAERDRMVDEVRAQARDTGVYSGRSRFHERVLDALRQVPRHAFVPEAQKTNAYLNRALPIGYDQTISQPFIVALMTELAAVEADDRVLEVGTGSGYQAAILAELSDSVYSVELLPELGRRAASILAELGYDEIELRIGDGYQGWPEAAPFDAIIVTAAPPEVPQALVEQLAVGGRMVVPVGEQGSAQTLQLLVKQADGSIETRDVIPVGFVPMVRPDDEPDTSANERE